MRVLPFCKQMHRPTCKLKKVLQDEHLMRAVCAAAGDTLLRIAERQGVTLRALIAANRQIENPDVIFPGQRQPAFTLLMSTVSASWVLNVKGAASSGVV